MISTVLTVYIGGLESIKGNISTGNIAEFIIYVNMLSWPVASVGWVTSLIQRAAASQERINEFLNTKSEIVNYTNEQTPIDGDIEFKNVSFTYPDTGIRALKNISFKINKGDSFCISGKSGVGKSTLVKIIMGLLNPTDGQVLINNRQINYNNVLLIKGDFRYEYKIIKIFRHFKGKCL